MSNKGWQGNFFEDFEIGREIDCPPARMLTDGDVSAYIAFTGDRTPRFCGPARLVHPLVTFHTVLGQTVRPVSLNARANLGYAGMRWLEPVRVGDTLSTRAEVIGLKENSSKSTGIVWVRTTAANQEGNTVLSYVRWVMVRKRDNDATAYLDAPVVPEVPSSVRAAELKVNGEALPTSRITGAPWVLGDYRPGERVFHVDGATVNASDHMSFTRLFQNSAKVHFDALLTSGKPLVYGGLPISFGYAQAYNGFENRLGIAAINGGNHANPVYSGDTLYSFTDVLDVDPLEDPHVGALRLRLVVVKNEDPLKGEAPGTYAIEVPDPKHPDRADRLVYNPNVVLDLDFWELVVK